jgi:hypothetical protein
MGTLLGNAILAPSGGPTAVIHSSAFGIIEDARQQTDTIRQFFGAPNSILDNVVAGEGARDVTGNHVAAQRSVDTFGRRQLGGGADYLRQMVRRELGVKARYNKRDTCQRNTIHSASRTESDEACLCGQKVVRHALAGAAGCVVRGTVAQAGATKTLGRQLTEYVSCAVRAFVRVSC